jgi:hypothetical protein
VAKTKKLSTINLKPQDEFEKSLVGKILRWSLSTGKSIVILTEFVVILAFLSRFKLDRDLNDLNEEIIQKQFIVESYEDTETKIVDIQDKLSLVAQIDNTTVKVKDTVNQLSQLVPVGVKINSIEFSQAGWNVVAEADTEQTYASFISRMENSGKFAQVIVSDIKYDLRNGKLSFSLTAEFDKKDSAKKVVKK